MIKFLKATWLFFLCAIISFAFLYGAKSYGYKQGYSIGYDAGFKKGLDTAAALNDKSFDSLMTEMRIEQKRMEDLLSELQAYQIESYPNHSEIKR